MGEGSSLDDGEGTPRLSTGGRTYLPPWWSQDPDRSLDPLPSSSCQPVEANVIVCSPGSGKDYQFFQPIPPVLRKSLHSRKPGSLRPSISIPRPPTQSVSKAVQQLIKNTEMMATTAPISCNRSGTRIQDVDFLTKLKEMYMVSQKIG